MLERTGLRTPLPLTSPDTPSEQIFAAIPLTAKRILLRELHERAWTIIQQRFGLEQREQHTLEEIGKKLHFTRERTRQREKQALLVLQDIFQRQSYVARRNQVHRCPTDLYIEKHIVSLRQLLMVQLDSVLVFRLTL